MKEIHWFYAPQVAETLALPTDEARHALRVLRMKEGDAIAITDGMGSLYDATICDMTNKHCGVRLDRQQQLPSLWKGKIALAVAPTKNMDRMEWLAEKATEIGWDALTFLHCQRSERRQVRTDRIEGILIAAMKQSRKCILPTLEGMTPFQTFIARPFEGQKFIAHCYADSDVSQPAVRLRDVVSADTNSLVLIGPEGDFSLEEVEAAIQAGFQPISLGDSRLRTETAALVAVHLMNLAKTQ